MSAGGRRKEEAKGEAERLSPGAHLRAEISRIGLDQVAVSKATGVSRQSVNNIVNDRQPISRAMAGKLGRLTGHSSDYWLSAYFSKPGGAPAKTDRLSVPTGPLVNHQILHALKQGIISIEPLAPRNVRAAAVDLTLSDTVQNADGGTVKISHGKGFLLEPGRTVIATTHEHIEFPFDYFGRIGIVDRLGDLGIIGSHAFQVEPGFRGHLRFCLFNAGGVSSRLRPRDAIISLEIARLSAAPSGRPPS